MYTRACALISGGMTSRPRTMPITSPSPTPGSTQRTLGGAPGVRVPYTTNHPYSGAPISTTAPYASNMGVGSSGMSAPYSGVAPTSSYGGVPTYAGGRGMQQRQMQYSSGQGQSGTCTCTCMMMSVTRHRV